MLSFRYRCHSVYSAKCVFLLAILQFLKKLNRQERVVEEVKLVLKPHYTKKHVTKEEYKDIMRKAVPKVSVKTFY